MPRIIHGGMTEGPKVESRGGGSWGGAATPSPPAMGSGERCELLHQGSGQSPDCLKVFYHFQHTQDGLS